MAEKTKAFQDTVMSLLASPTVLQIVSNIVTPRVSEAIPRMVNSAQGQRTMSRQQRDIFTSEKNRQEATSSVVGDFMRFAMSNPKVIEAVVGIVSNMGVASAAKTSTLRGGKQNTSPTTLFADTFSTTIVDTITNLLSDFFGNRLLCLLGNFAKQFLVRAADTALTGLLCGSDNNDCCNGGYGLTGNCGCYHKPRNCSCCKMSCADRCAALRYGYCGSVGGSWRPGCCASFCGGDCDECVRCCEPACCRDCCCGGGCSGGGGCGCNGGGGCGCGCNRCGAFGCGPSGGGGCGSPSECTIFNRQYCGGNGCDGYSPIPTQGGCCGGFGIAQPFSGCPIGVPACAGPHCCAPCGC